MPLLIGTTREEFRLFLVPTGGAGTLTSDSLSAMAIRYGWPATALETYAANRSGSTPGDIACAVLTDAGFRLPATELATAQTAAGGSVYAYELAWRTPVADLGACHGLDLGFVFDTLGAGAPMAGETAPAELATQMHDAWVRFAVDGTPGWRPWTPDDRAVMTFDAASHLAQAPRADELALWS